jgi:hypothetical protein
MLFVGMRGEIENAEITCSCDAHCSSFAIGQTAAFAGPWDHRWRQGSVNENQDFCDHKDDWDGSHRHIGGCLRDNKPDEGRLASEPFRRRQRLPLGSAVHRRVLDSHTQRISMQKHQTGVPMPRTTTNLSLCDEQICQLR